MLELRNLPLSALRAFERAAEHLHLGRAGEDLGVTHGAISHQVRALERTLGVQLFSRANKRLELTPIGKRLYRSVQNGFGVILDGARNLDPEGLNGAMTIACTQTIATSWATRLICEFNQEYPGIEISVREIQPRQTNIPRDIDVAICYGEPKPDDREITVLAAPSLFPVYSPKLTGGSPGLMSIKDLKNFTLIHDHQVSWTTWLKYFQLDPAEFDKNIHFPNTSQALTAARLGYGVALGNAFETHEFIREGLLLHMQKRSVREAKKYYLLGQPANSRSLKVEIFEEWIIKACQQFTQ